MKNFLYILILCSFLVHICNAQAVWNQYNGPYSGNIMTFTSKGDTLFCGANFKAIYMSTDKGFNWKEIVVPDYGNINTIYYFNEKLFASWASLTYYSTNNGESWDQFVELTGTNKFYEFGGNLYAGTNNGFYSYCSITNSWIDKSNGMEPNDALGVNRNVRCITNIGSNLFCGTLTTGLYFSADTGNVWNKIPEESGFAATQILSMISLNDTIFVPNYFDRKIYFSSDTGKSWTGLNISNEQLSINDITAYKGKVLIAANEGVYQFNSINQTWENLSNEPITKIFGIDSILLASNALSLYRWSLEKDSFIYSNSGINTSEVYGIEIFNNALYSATSGGLYYTYNDGETWDIVPESKGIVCQNIIKSDTALYVSSVKGILAHYLNSNSWHYLNNGLVSTNVWDIKRTESYMYAATDAGLFVSDDIGENWKQVMGYDGQFTKIAYDSSMILLANANGLFQLNEGNDSIITTGFQGKSVSSVNIYEGTVFVGLSEGGIYKSIDSCKTWSKHAELGIYDLSKRGNSNLYAAGFNQIYYSPDNGENWEYWSETGMPNFFIKCIYQSDNAFYAGTIGNSIYKRAYLNLTDFSSEMYEIDGNQIYIPESDFNIDSLNQNMQIAHGASIVVNKKSKMKDAEINVNKGINSNEDFIEIVAEDGHTKKQLKIQIITGVNTDEINNFYIFPNPSSDRLYFSEPNEIKYIRVFDVRGIELYRTKMENDYFDINNFSNGLYFIEITTQKNKKIILKFIKK